MGSTLIVRSLEFQNRKKKSVSVHINGLPYFNDEEIEVQTKLQFQGWIHLPIIFSHPLWQLVSLIIREKNFKEKASDSIWFLIHHSKENTKDIKVDDLISYNAAHLDN